MTARSLYPDVPATECRLGFRPKCLICGGDILASSACCCLAACLYSLDITRRLSVNPTGLVKTFTCVLQLLDQPRAPPALVVNRKRGPLEGAGKGSMPANQLNCSPMTFG